MPSAHDDDRRIHHSLFANPQPDILTIDEAPQMSIAEIEKRLIALERQLAQLAANPPSNATQHPLETLERIHGAFEDDDAFKEANRLGRKWRQSQRPNGRKSKAKRK
jgi:hypothetical protein